MMFKNKRGWIKIVEAFFAILLIIGVSLVVLSNNLSRESDSSQQFYDLEVSVLREIQLDDALRDDILYTTPLPSIPSEAVQLKINASVPEYLHCQSRICELDLPCELNNPLKKNIFAQSEAISSNLTDYSPKQLKLFCWNK